MYSIHYVYVKEVFSVVILNKEIVKIHNLKCVCSYLSRDIRLNQLLRVRIE